MTTTPPGQRLLTAAIIDATAAGIVGAARSADWRPGVLAFTLPTLAATYLHRDVFDFDRLFAMAWVVLSVASPVTFALLLWNGRHAGVAGYRAGLLIVVAVPALVVARGVRR